jgi:hypothetical protein
MSIASVIHVHGCVRIKVRKCKPSDINGLRSYDIILEDEKGSQAAVYAFEKDTETEIKISYEEE